MTVRQHSFYLEDDDWVALRHYCLDRGISVSAFVAQAARDAILDSPTKNVAPPISEVQLHEVSVVKEPPHPSMTIKTATGAPATVPYNPVRAVPKPATKKRATRARIGA